MGSRGPRPRGLGHHPASVVPLRDVEIMPAGDTKHSGVPVPEPPENLLPEIVEQWYAYWKSPVARAIDAHTDLHALRRLFRARNEWLIADTAFRKEMIVVGSVGQPRVSPYAAIRDKAEDTMQKLEDRFGLTPMSRVRLGIAIGDAKKTAADLNKAAEAAERTHAHNETKRGGKAKAQQPVEEDDLAGWQEA